MKTIKIALPIRKILSIHVAAFSVATLLQVCPALVLASEVDSVPGQALIDHVDHIVLTASDPEATIHFYTQVLGMRMEKFGEGRIAFKFGTQKINMHIRGHEVEPKAHLPVPGSLDLCFISSVPLNDFIAHLKKLNWPIAEGPVSRTGANGPIRSVYVRDPDLNLIEVSEYQQN